MVDEGLPRPLLSGHFGGRRQRGKKGRGDELVVAGADAVVEPNAMMIKAEDAGVAASTVLGARLSARGLSVTNWMLSQMEESL